MHREDNGHFREEHGVAVTCLLRSVCGSVKDQAIGAGADLWADLSNPAIVICAAIADLGPAFWAEVLKANRDASSGHPARGVQYVRRDQAHAVPPTKLTLCPRQSSRCAPDKAHAVPPSSFRSRISLICCSSPLTTCHSVLESLLSLLRHSSRSSSPVLPDAHTR